MRIVLTKKEAFELFKKVLPGDFVDDMEIYRVDQEYNGDVTIELMEKPKEAPAPKEPTVAVEEEF